MSNDIPSEDHEQMMFVQWFRRAYPGVLIYAIPNGGKRSPATAAKLKATGVVPGIPDLHVPEWKLRIEMKRIKCGRVSDDQKEIMQYLTDKVGDTCLVCNGNEKAQQSVRSFVADKSHLRYDSAINNGEHIG